MSLLATFRRCVAGSDRRLRNMARVMHRAGLDSEVFAWRREGRDLAEAVRVCRICPSLGRCDEWLSAPATKGRGIPPFCPNADRFLRAQPASDVSRNSPARP